MKFNKGDIVVINKSGFLATIIKRKKKGTYVCEWISPVDGAICHCEVKEDLLSLYQS